MDLRVVHLSTGWTVALDCAVWAVGGTAIGYLTNKFPIERFDQDSVVTRLRSWEDDGHHYERRWAIKRWKRWLPEAGDLFGDGFSKRDLRAANPDYLERFVVETRRAEVTHWWVLALGPFFVLWNPPWLALVMNGYAIAANVPCLVVQRYNRARLIRVLARVRCRRASTSSDAPA